MASNKKKNNKGAALVLALGFASIMLTLSVGYVGSAISESNNCQRQQDAIISLYEAERGAQYAATELRNAGWDFFTHQRSLSDLDGNLALDDLENVTTPPAPSIVNSTYASGNYRITTVSSVTDVRTYVNPLDTDEVFILSRTNVAATHTQKIIKMKVSTTSLYQNFVFSPFDMPLRSVEGRGIGRIHANGNIIWQSDSNATNLTEVSCGGYMRYPYGYRIPSYLLDGLDGIIDGHAPEPSASDTRRGWDLTDYNNWFNSLSAAQQAVATAAIGGVPQFPPAAWNQRDYPWLKLNSNSGGYPWHPDWASISGNFDVSSFQVNRGAIYDWSEVTDSNVFPSWQRPHYDYRFGPNSAYPPFYYTPGNNFTNYHGGTYNLTTRQEVFNNLDSLFGSNMTINGVPIPRGLSGQPYSFDPFYQDPIVDDIHTVDYTNSEIQPDSWYNFVNATLIPTGSGQPFEGEPLMSVLKDANTGGEVISPVEVEAGYFNNLALSGGIYIYSDGTANRALPAGVINTTSFFNTMRPPGSWSGGTYTPTMDQAVNINVEELKAWVEGSGEAFNGVIYFDGQGCSDCGVKLTHAKQLPNITDSNPNGGLTVFSTRQVYLQGDFNYDSTEDEAYNNAIWQPAGIITQNIMYYLSDGFEQNEPQSLPAPVHNINYPQIGDGTYWNDNVDAMPNEALVEPSSGHTVTYRTSIVSTENLWQDNILERWRNGQNGVRYNRRHIGANVRFDASTTSIPFGATSVFRRNRTYGGGVPLLTDYTGRSPVFEYDTNLQNRVPPGDFLGGSQASWQEVSDFDHI